MADDQTLGRRVAYWRNRRKMSQQVFADRLGKSKSWVDKVERGVRRLDRFSVMDEIANVLQLDVQLLMSPANAGRPAGGHRSAEASVDAIRSALEHYDKIVSFGVRPATAPLLSELTKAVSHAWLTYHHSGLQALGHLLPQLVRDAQTANAYYVGDEGLRAAHLLSQVFQIASSSLRTLGQNDLAWLAAERAVAASQQADDDLLFAASIAQVAESLAALGRLRPALEISISAANQLAPDHDAEANPEQLSVYGKLILQSALMAAKLGDAATAQDLAGAAEDPAERLGREDSYYATSFGPTTLLLHRVAAAIELGEMARAVSIHNAITAEAFAAMTPERRANHLLNLARAHSQLGDVTSATNTLMEAAHLAQAEVRHHPVTERLVADIVRCSDGSATPALTALADVLGHSRPARARA